MTLVDLESVAFFFSLSFSPNPGLNWDQDTLSVRIGSQGQPTQGSLHLMSLPSFPESFIESRLFQPTKALLSSFLIRIDLALSLQTETMSLPSNLPSLRSFCSLEERRMDPTNTISFIWGNLRSGLTSCSHLLKKLKNHYRLQNPFKIHSCESNWISFIPFQKAFWKMELSLVWQKWVEHTENPQPFSQLKLDFQNYLFLSPGVMTTLSSPSSAGSATTTPSHPGHQSFYGSSE